MRVSARSKPLQAVVLGCSQGDQAAVRAAEIADYVAGSAEILGAAALTPAKALEQIKTEAYVKKACGSGTTVSYNHYADTDHLRIPARALADFLNWFADRFAGKRAPSDCT